MNVKNKHMTVYFEHLMNIRYKMFDIFLTYCKKKEGRSPLYKTT